MDILGLVWALCLRELLQVCEVLVSAGGLLVELKVFEIDQVGRDAVNGIVNSFLVALGEIDAGDSGRDFYSHRWQAQPNDLPWLQEQFRRQVGRIEAEVFERRDDFVGVVGVDRDPQVHVGRGAGITVVAYGVPADEEVLNAVGVEQSQELFEVGW